MSSTYKLFSLIAASSSSGDVHSLITCKFCMEVKAEVSIVISFKEISVEFTSSSWWKNKVHFLSELCSNVTSCNSCECRGTFLFTQIYDGSTTAAPVLAQGLSGLSLPNTTVYTSSGNQVFIVMDSDGSVVNRGFHATYTELIPGGRLHTSPAKSIFTVIKSDSSRGHCRCKSEVIHLPRKVMK